MAGNVRTDEVQLRVVIDGSPARKELATLSQETYKLRDDLKGMKKGSDEANAALAKIAQNEARMSELRKELGLTGLSLKELRAEAAKLEGQLRTMVPGTQEWAEVNAQLQQVKQRMEAVGSAAGRHAAAWEAVREQYKLTDMTMEQLEAESRRLTNVLRNLKPDTPEFRQYRRELEAVNERHAQLRTGLGPLARAWSDVKMQVAGAFSVLGAMFAGGMIVNGLRNWVAGSAALSDELANVQKATGMTREQVKGLNQDLQNLNTRTATSDLREIAVGLGQVGEEVSASSVAAIDKINVALGDEFGAGAREITTTISVLRNNLGDLKSGNYADDVTRIGNALNELGANGLATAPVVSDIANRVAGVAQSFGIASGEILGVAATFQELGIQAERGSTAYVKVLQRIASEPAKFAAVVEAAGMDVDLFNQQVNTDMQAAFVTVAKAAKAAGAENTAFAAILKELDVDGAGVSELLSKMGQNAEMLAEKSKLATEALRSTSSITGEFNTKNATLGATLDKIGKALAGMFVNSSIMSGIEAMVGWFGRMLGINEAMSVSLAKERVEMNALFEVMKSGNITTEQRRDLIADINTKYGEYLDGQLSEFANLKAIEQAQTAVNAAMLKRIEIEAKREIIAEQAERVAKAQKELIEAELALARFQQNPSQSGNLADRGLTLETRVKAAANDLQAATADYEDVMKRLGDALAEPARPSRPAGAPTPTSTPNPATPAAGATEAVDQMERLRAQLREIQEGMLRDAMTSSEREVAEVDSKYAKLRAEIMKQESATAEDLRLLDEVYAQERANAIEAGGQKRIDAANKVADELRRVEQEAADQVYLDQQTAEDREVLQAMQQFDAMVALYEKAGVDTAELVERTERFIAAIRKKYRDQENNQAKADLQRKRQQNQQMAMEVASAVGSVNGVLAAFYSSANQMAYEQTVASKALGLLQIGLSSAVGVAKAIEAGAGLTFPANLGAIASGVAAVLSGVAQARNLFGQVGTPTPPSGNAGNAANLQNVPIGEAGMVIDGPRHSEGGLQVWDPVRQRLVAEIEGGETVLSRKWTRANADLLPALLQASREGRRMNWLNTAPAPINVGAVRSAMQVVHLAAGGRVPHVRGTALVNAAGPTGGPGGTPDWALAMLGKMDQMVKAQREFPKRLQAEVVNSPKKDRTDAEYARIKGRNSFRRAS